MFTAFNAISQRPATGRDGMRAWSMDCGAMYTQAITAGQPRLALAYHLEDPAPPGRTRS